MFLWLLLPSFLQQQEDFKFLSHFGGKFIIHQVGAYIDLEATGKC